MKSTYAHTVAPDDLLNDSILREQLIPRLEVLDKVKRLLLISYNEMATVGQIAKYYDVSDSMLRKCIHRNRDELEKDGISVLSSSDFRARHNAALKQSFRGYALYEDAEGNEFILSAAKTMFLSRRAILRIGMLLRDSIVAHEVRTQLLNIEERASDEQRTADVDEAHALLWKITTSENAAERSVALSEYNELINHRTAVLRDENDTLTAENCALAAEKDILNAANDTLSAEKDILNIENDALARKELDWQPRAIVEKLIRTYAARGFRDCPFSYAASLSWQRFYDELYYEYRISLASRRKRSKLSRSPALDFVREEEWPVLVAKAFAMCRRLGCDVAAIIGNDVVMERIEQSVREAARYVPQPQPEAAATCN